MQKPTIGRTVHYVLENGRHRPMIIVEVLDEDCVAGVLFLDGKRDDSTITERRNDTDTECTKWIQNSWCDEAKRPGTWHWPEREEA